MVVYQLECGECDEKRIGTETGDEIRPVKSECPKCGSAEYDVLAHD